MRMNPCLLGTACVPWSGEDEFLEDVFRVSVRNLIKQGLENLYVFGTAGEGYAITEEMFFRIATVFHDEMRGSKGFSQLGVIGMSVPQIKSRIDIGVAIGFHFFQISLPPWGRVNDREMNAFFDDILGSYPDERFLHYNTLRGARRLTPRDYGAIASRHANLVATKIAADTPADMAALFHYAPDVCHFFCEFAFSYARLLGECGLLVSLSAMVPSKAHLLFDAARSGAAKAVVELIHEMSVVHEILMSSHKCGQHMDGSYDKMFSKVATPAFPLRLLPPYEGAGDEEFMAFIGEVGRQAPVWLLEHQ